MMEKNYRDKQYEQHHHHPTDNTLATAASTSKYLDTLSRSSWDSYKTTLRTVNQAEHDESLLSDKLQIMKNLLTWEDYKHLVTKLQLTKGECLELQEEVQSLKKKLLLLQEEEEEVDDDEERSSSTAVHQYVPQPPDDKGVELKTLEDKAKEYDEAIQESNSNVVKVNNEVRSRYDGINLHMSG